MRLASIALAFAFAGLATADEPKPKPAPLTANNANELRQQYDRQMKDFADTIEKLKDNPEAREAIEKARDEFKKGMEDKIKEADKAIPQGREGRFAQPLFPEFPLPVFPDGDLGKMQQELFNERMNALRALQELNGLGFARGNGRLGMQLAAVPAVLTEQLGLEKNVGVVLAAVQPDSAADKAGLKANDVLLQVGGKDLPAEVGLAVNQLSGAKEGEKLDFVVLRQGKKVEVKGLEVPAAPAPARRPAGKAAKGFQMTVVNGAGTITGTFDGGLEITATGPVKDGALDPTKIVVKDGAEKIEADSVEKVPEKYRGRVEKLLGAKGGNRRER